MDKILSDLLISLVKSSTDTLSFALKDFVELGLYAEKNLGKLLIGTASTLNFDNIFLTCRTIGLALLVMLTIKKFFETYILEENDADTSPFNLLFNFSKAIILVLSFDFLYELLATSTNEITTLLLNSITIENVMDINIVTYLLSSMTTGFFTVIAFVVAIVLYLILYFQFILRGLEMLVLRIAFPFAVSGLLHSNKGSFAPFIRKFIQSAFTIITQIVLAKVSLGLLVSGHLIYGLACTILAVRTPKFLNEFIITSTNGNAFSMYNINATKNLAKSVASLFTKKVA